MDEVLELFDVLRKRRPVEQIEKAQIRLTEIATPQQIMDRLNDPSENTILLSQLIWTATEMYQKSINDFENLEQTLCMLAKHNDSPVRYNACDGLGRLKQTPAVKATLRALTLDPVAAIRELANYYIEYEDEIQRRLYELEAI